MKKTKRSLLKQWVWAFIIALVLALICRAFIVQSFIVSNTRMSKTLEPGDFIFVEKLSFGGRWPITMLTVPFTNIYSSAIQIPYMRMPGAGKINRNDIIVFNYPFFTDQPVDKREMQIKRCVALPGDTITISNKIVSINQSVVKSPEKAQYKFRIVTNGSKLPTDFINKYQLNDGGSVSNIGIYDFPMVRSLADSLLNDTIIKYVRELKDFDGDNCSGIFPQDRHFTWNKDFLVRFGFLRKVPLLTSILKTCPYTGR
jgi:signal peptidase I